MTAGLRATRTFLGSWAEFAGSANFLPSLPGRSSVEIQVLAHIPPVAPPGATGAGWTCLSDRLPFARANNQGIGQCCFRASVKGMLRVRDRGHFSSLIFSLLRFVLSFFLLVCLVVVARGGLPREWGDRENSF